MNNGFGPPARQALSGACGEALLRSVSVVQKAQVVIFLGVVVFIMFMPLLQQLQQLRLLRCSQDRTSREKTLISLRRIQSVVKSTVVHCHSRGRLEFCDERNGISFWSLPLLMFLGGSQPRRTG